MSSTDVSGTQAPLPVQTMNAAEARACVESINSSINNARAMLLDLYERQGWKALGYESWRACVVVEFEQSKTHLYRQLQAAEIERTVSPMGEIGQIPERQLRPLAALPPAERPKAWALARESSGGKPTAKDVQAAVNTVR